MVVVPEVEGVKVVEALYDPAGMVMVLEEMVPTAVLELVTAMVAEPGPTAQGYPPLLLPIPWQKVARDSVPGLRTAAPTEIEFGEEKVVVLKARLFETRPEG
jgi:hypothetical protein